MWVYIYTYILTTYIRMYTYIYLGMTWRAVRHRGSQFTCFTGTKVQILTQRTCAAGAGNAVDIVEYAPTLSRVPFRQRFLYIRVEFRVNLRFRV